MSDSDSTPPRSHLGTDLTLLGDEHVRKYRETDGEIGYLWNGATACLLTTKGRKSGEDRTIAIIFKQVGDRYAIIASKGGSPAHPAWYLNVVDDPHVTLQIKGGDLRRDRAHGRRCRASGIVGRLARAVAELRYLPVAHRAEYPGGSGRAGLSGQDLLISAER